MSFITSSSISVLFFSIFTEALVSVDILRGSIVKVEEEIVGVEIFLWISRSFDFSLVASTSFLTVEPAMPSNMEEDSLSNLFIFALFSSMSWIALAELSSSSCVASSLRTIVLRMGTNALLSSDSRPHRKDAAVFRHLPSSLLYTLRSWRIVLCKRVSPPSPLSGYSSVRIRPPSISAYFTPLSVNKPPHLSTNIASVTISLPSFSLNFFGFICILRSIPWNEPDSSSTSRIKFYFFTFISELAFS